MESFAPLPSDLFADSSNFLEEDPYFSLSQFDLELQQQAQAALLDSWQDFDKYVPVNNNNIKNDFMQAQPIFTPTTTSLFYEPIIPTTKSQIKNEYASPESLPHSPPQNDMIIPSSPKTANPFDFMSWPSSDTAQGKVPIQRLKSNSIITNAVNAALNNITPTGRQHKKTAHNAIERRYRNNINDRITELKNAVPALLYAKVKTNAGKRAHDNDDEDGEDGEEYLDGVAVATKLNKATILRKATEYINHLKKTGDDVRRENETLQHILHQLPGGADILQRYHFQKQQRDNSNIQLQLNNDEEQEQQQQQQQQKRKNRKRTKYNSDEYNTTSSSSPSPGPVTPPAITSRVFMAAFMSIAFFSTSPTTNNNSNHHTSSDHFADNTTIHNNESFFSSFFKFDDIWSTLRILLFIFCFSQLLLPYFFSLKLKRVNKRATSNTSAASTPGELKCREIHHILTHHDNNNNRHRVISFIKESVLFFSHHILGYDILYGPTTEDHVTLYKWIKLNEIQCIGGDLGISRFTLLYSCLRMINLVDALTDEDGDDDEGTNRAYATAALQMPLIFPNRFLADKLSAYFWQHYEDEEEHGILLPEDPCDSSAWERTVQVLCTQTNTRSSQQQQQLGLSYTTPITSPLAILSTFHLLEYLQDQFNKLIHNMASGTTTIKTEFGHVVSMMDNNELVHWLAIVGAMTEALWHNNNKAAVEYLPDLLRSTPTSMSCSNIAHRGLLHQQDETVKKVIVHTLKGTLFLMNDTNNKEAALVEFQNAQTLRQKYRHEGDLESTVVALAEFAVSLVGLEAWIQNNNNNNDDDDDDDDDELARQVTLHLRRMLRFPLFLQQENNHILVDRLSRLSRRMAD